MKYELQVSLKPSCNYIHVVMNIMDLPDNVFYLNEKFKIIKAKAGNEEIEYSVDKDAPRPLFDNSSRPVTFHTTSNKMEVEYIGVMDEVIDDINQIKEDIIELSIYSGWFLKPYNVENFFDFEIQLDIPNDYYVVSNGKVINNKIVSTKPQFDIVLFATKTLNKIDIKQHPVNNTFIYPSTLNDTINQRIKYLQQASELYQQWYGQNITVNQTTECTYVYRLDKWGYKRDNIVFMNINDIHNYHNDFHELAHGWWNIANVDKVDWFNEGCAEYSAYQAIEALQGKKFAGECLKKYIDEVKASSSTTSIKDTTSSSPERYLNHYTKTTIMFIMAQAIFGKEQVHTLLKNVYKIYCSSGLQKTDDFLALCNPQMKIFFQEYLTKEVWVEADYSIIVL